MKSLEPQGALFLFLALFTLSPWSSPPQALLLGMALGLLVGHPYGKQSKKLSGLLLRLCVVLLGFGMNLSTVLSAGARGFAMAAVTIALTFLLGTVLGRMLRVPARTSLLITAGTAICGGSAIAAVGTVTAAEEGEMTVAIVACSKSLKKMHLEPVQLYPFVKTVDSGAAEVVRKQESGWSYLRQ